MLDRFLRIVIHRALTRGDNSTPVHAQTVSGVRPLHGRTKSKGVCPIAAVGEGEEEEAGGVEAGEGGGMDGCARGTKRLVP